MTSPVLGRYSCLDTFGGWSTFGRDGRERFMLPEQKKKSLSALFLPFLQIHSHNNKNGYQKIATDLRRRRGWGRQEIL